MGLVGACWELIEAGRVKLYSCDSVAGAVMLRDEGSPLYRAAVLNGFHHFVRHELIPAVRLDCQTPDLAMITAGASIGAFNAVATLCRFPDVITHAIGLSGTYDIARFIHGDGGMDLFFSSPLAFLPGLDGPLLDLLRRRFVVLASGQGRWENLGESWHMADALGAKYIPNRVDPWGQEYDHDWPSWRRMLPQYLHELT